ncbi:hypothetical protein ACIBHY_53910 [Nonomuraea sp. NPDC050547]|uniref:hypothetical protein n=1 Tax=Nonomuraea sp. NPDC050547 TaxID=3364368 RepID=UPI0037BC4A9E
MGDADELEPYTEVDEHGVKAVYYGDGELDIETTSQKADQDNEEDERAMQGEYNPIRWCVVCGWSTENQDEQECGCEDGPRC